MKSPPPLSPALEALLAPHRTVLPLAPWVEARAVARAAAAEPSERAAARVVARPWWVFAAAAAGVVLALGAGAYAARVWQVWQVRIGGPSSRAPEPAPPPPAPRATEPPPMVSGASEREAPPRKRAAIKTSAAPGRPTNAELQLLRAARQDVTRGDFARGLEVLAEHAHRFRHGSLVEEREALRVKALAGLGRQEEAQHAAFVFRARFPHSVFLATFERMKETGR
jgi:hypothetical protein